MRRKEADHRRSSDFILSAVGTQDAQRGMVVQIAFSQKCLGYKTTIRYCHKIIKMAKIPPKLIIPNAGEDVEQQRLPFIAGGSANWHSHFGRRSGWFL